MRLYDRYLVMVFGWLRAKMQTVLLDNLSSIAKSPESESKNRLTIRRQYQQFLTRGLPLFAALDTKDLPHLHYRTSDLRAKLGFSKIIIVLRQQAWR